jgi:predicted nucleic acid-binding protein
MNARNERNAHWQMQEAKAMLSAVIRSAVVLSIEEYRKLNPKKQSIVEFFQNSPWADVELDLERDKSYGMREIDLLKYLLDTNVLSEIRYPKGNPKVLAYVNAIPQEELFISAVTIGEIAKGMEKLPDGKKKTELSIWLTKQIPDGFKNRIIPLDFEFMLEWGRFRAKERRTFPIIDSLIAVTALSRRMILLTRNTRDFEDIGGLNLLNPWEE